MSLRTASITIDAVVTASYGAKLRTHYRVIIPNLCRHTAHAVGCYGVKLWAHYRVIIPNLCRHMAHPVGCGEARTASFAFTQETVMTEYRRAHVPGASWFFTANLKNSPLGAMSLRTASITIDAVVTASYGVKLRAHYRVVIPNLCRHTAHAVGCYGVKLRAHYRVIIPNLHLPMAHTVGCGEARTASFA